jgi:glycosyltransferase involved in cell wall biosynthesis
MRIGFFSPTINRIGGGEWVTLNMIHALNARKYEIVVYSAERINSAHIPSFFGNSLSIDNQINFWPNIFDPFSLENIYPNLLKSFFFSLKCNLLIDTFSNDLYPWTDAVYFQGTPRTLRLPKGAKKLAFLPYKTFSTTTTKYSKSKDKILMACSKHAAKTIENLTGLPVHVLYPPISDYFRIRGNHHERRNNLAATVIRIAEDKRPNTIPQIAKMVSDDITFIIIGNCKTAYEKNVLQSLRKSIRELGVEKKVKVLLNVSREKQREILQSSKVYLHPLVPYESFGISAVEAMSAGCTPIVPDIGGLKEIVPRKLRYSTLEQAASLVEASINNWSPQTAEEFEESTNRFSQARFETEFLEILKL